MAWYEQLDLDFGSIQDQFTEIMGEATTLLESANNLEILNLDAMAVQEELEEALQKEQEEEEYEEEDEVVYHELPTQSDHTHEPTQHEERSCSPTPQVSASATMQSPVRISRNSDTPDLEDGWAQDTSIAFTSAPPTVEKAPRSVIDASEVGATPSKMDSSYNWEGVEALPAKAASKLNTFATITRSTDTASYPTPAASAADVSTTGNPSFPSEKRHLEPGTQSQPPLPARPTPQAAPTPQKGRKVKPLKPKEKVKKELDFWGVNSKKTIKFDAIDKKRGSAPDPQRAIDTISAALNSSGSATQSSSSNTRGGKKDRESSLVPADGFFGTMGLFDEAYGSDENATDVESASASSGGQQRRVSAAAAVAGKTGAADSPHPMHSQRLPLGWLSSMVSGVGDGSTDAAVPSFFDDLDGDVEDPILKQVEFNRLHPQQAAQQRAASSGSGVARVLDMWHSFMGDDDEEQPVDPFEELHNASGSGSGGGGSGGSGSTGTTTDTAPPPAFTTEPFVAGVGPSWVVAMLTWFRFITGVTLVVVDAAQAVRYSPDTGGTGGYGALGSVRQLLRRNLARVNFAVFTVRVPVLANYRAESVAIFALHVLKVVVLTVLAMLLRVLVVACTLLFACLRSAIQYLSGTAMVRDVVNNPRLRRFFGNANVSALLGRDSEAPSDEGWREQCTRNVRQAATSLWEMMNSNNGILVLTAALFLFSYYKFGRYGTDTGD